MSASSCASCLSCAAVRRAVPGAPHRSCAPCSTRRARYSSALTPGGRGKAGSVGLELLEAEGAALGDGERGAHAFGRVPRQRRAICAAPLRYHSPLGRRRVPIWSSVRSWRSAREDVVHHAVARAGVVHVVGDDPRDVERARDVDERARWSRAPRAGRGPSTRGDAARRRGRAAWRRLRTRRPSSPRAASVRHPAARAAGEGEEARRRATRAGRA